MYICFAKLNVSDMDSIESKLNQSPTWAEIIDLFVEMESKNEAFRIMIIQHIMSFSEIDNIEDRENFTIGFAEKMDMSLLRFREELYPTFLTKLMQSKAKFGFVPSPNASTNVK